MLTSNRGLFVIGAARSGTTVLQNALNHAQDIHLLGEPDLHLEEGAPGFAARFNAMHRGWNNQPTKSTWLPSLLDEDGHWRPYLDRLAAYHRWVGSKIVVNPGHSPAWLERLERFQSLHFYDAHYLFVFRHPGAVARSFRGMQEATGGVPDGPAVALANFAETVALFTKMTRTFPHVRAVIHEDIAPAAFDAVGEWLGVDLGEASSYYDTARIRRYEQAPSSAEDEQFIAQTTLLYEDLRRMIAAGIEQPQLEQNDGNLTPNHYTALGSIDRRARFLKECLVDQAAIPGE